MNICRPGTTANNGHAVARIKPDEIAVDFCVWYGDIDAVATIGQVRGAGFFGADMIVADLRSGGAASPGQKNPFASVAGNNVASRWRRIAN